MNQKKRNSAGPVLLAGLLLAACSGEVTSKRVHPDAPGANAPAAVSPVGKAEIASPAAAAVDDPIEPFNRKVFWLNDHLDLYVLEPAAKAWDWALPDRVQHSISDFFANLRFPIVVTNDLLQGKARAAGVEVARFGVNTTIGVAGFLDPATSFGLEAHVEDFGQTLGWWGVAPGAYVVLPVLGPSNLRDAVGLAVDYPTSIVPFFIDTYILMGATAADTVNQRSVYLHELAEAKRSAVDYYVFVRDAYAQRRRALVNDSREVPRESEENLYFPDEEQK